MSDQQPIANNSNAYSITAIVLGGISFLLVPILFGAASIIVAMIAKNKKEKYENGNTYRISLYNPKCT